MPNEKALLSFTPRFDLPTRYVAAYADLVALEAENSGFTVIRLDDGYAVEEQLLDALTQHDPLFCLFATHGNESELSGFEGQLAMKKCINDDVMKGRIGAFVACATGIELGPSMVSKDCLAYIGFHDDYIFLVESEATPPLEDEYAKGFMEAAFTPIRVLLAGGTLKQAYDAAIEKYNEWISIWSQSSDPVASEILTYLVHDRNVLVAISGEEYLRLIVPKANLAPLLVPAFGLLYLLVAGS